jgi:hypothetical protein
VGRASPPASGLTPRTWQEPAKKAAEDAADVARLPGRPVHAPRAADSPEVPPPAQNAPVDFRRVAVNHRVVEAQKGGLALELSNAKRQGSVVGAGAGGLACCVRVEGLGRVSADGRRAAGNVRLKIYLPDRRPMELRVSKLATVEETIRASLDRGIRRGLKAERYELRMHDEDGLPNEDFPALDRSSVISEVRCWPAGRGG